MLRNWPKIFFVEVEKIIDSREIREKSNKANWSSCFVLSPRILFPLTRLIFNWLFNIKEELSYFLSLFLSFRGYFIDSCTYEKNLTLTCATFNTCLSRIAHFRLSQYDNVWLVADARPSTCTVEDEKNYSTSSAINLLRLSLSPFASPCIRLQSPLAFSHYKFCIIAFSGVWERESALNLFSELFFGCFSVE